MSAKKKSASKGTGNQRFYLLLGIVALLGIGAIGYAIRGGGGGAATTPVVVEGIEDARTLFSKAEGITIGSEDAKVTVVIFSDYQCPACRTFSVQMKPLLEENHVATGQARLVYYDLPLTSIHPHAFLAARAARCAGEQGMYWEYSEALFMNQPTWSARPGAPLRDFKGYASEIGLDKSAFESCLESDAYAETVTANALLAQQLGVNGTPTVIINNRRVRNPGDYAAIRGLIEEEAGE